MLHGCRKARPDLQSLQPHAPTMALHVQEEPLSHVRGLTLSSEVMQ